MLSAFLLAGCGDGADDGSGPLVAPPVRSVTPTADPAVVGDPSGCPLDELRPVLEGSVSKAPGVRIGEVVLTHCVDGHALVRLVAAPDPSGQAAVDDLLALLRRDGPRWTLVTAGPMLFCDDLDGVPVTTVDMCRAFTT